MCTPVRDVGEEDDFGNGVFDECFGAHDETFGHFDTFDTFGTSAVRGSHASRTNTNPLSANGNGKYYRFAHNTRAVRSNFVHFQLRNLVWATSKNDAYVMSENRVVHWNAATRRATTALDLDGGGGGGLTNHGRRDDETRDDARDNGARSARGEAFSTTTISFRKTKPPTTTAVVFAIRVRVRLAATAAERLSRSPGTSRASR